MRTPRRIYIEIWRYGGSCESDAVAANAIKGGCNPRPQLFDAMAFNTHESDAVAVNVAKGGGGGRGGGKERDVCGGMYASGNLMP